MEVEGIGGPGGEAHDEEEPVAPGELGKQADGVAQWDGPRPLRASLAELVGDNNTLLEVEQVVP